MSERNILRDGKNTRLKITFFKQGNSKNQQTRTQENIKIEETEKEEKSEEKKLK